MVNERLLEEMKLIIDNLPLGINLLDLEMRIVRVNRWVEKALGKKLEEIKGKFCYEVVGQYIKDPEKKGRGACGNCGVVKALEDGRVHIFERPIRPNLIIRNIAVPVKEDGRIVAVLEIIQDITERRKMEESLREDEKKYRDLWENADDVLFLIDTDGNFLELNKTARDLLGYTEEEVRQLNIRDVIDRDYHTLVFSEIDRLIKSRTEVSFLELLCHNKNGEQIWIESRAKPIIEGDGVKAIQGIARDITERKRLEQALRDSEEMFRKLAEKSLVGVYLIQDGVFKYVNPKLAELWGYEVNELIGMDPLLFVHPEDRERVRKNLERRIKGEIESVNYILKVINKSRKVRYNEVFGSRIIYKGKPAVIGTLIDVTEKIELIGAKLRAFEQIERNIEKYAYLVDQIRNPLSVILGIVELKFDNLVKNLNSAEFKDFEELKRVVIDSVRRIEEVVSELDRGWFESERIRSFLRDGIDNELKWLEGIRLEK
jgi:PAS domain S-box-containing protein